VSLVETVNDADELLMNFWKQLRDEPDEMRRLMALTPHSRRETDLNREQVASIEDPLERARQTWSLLAQSRNGTLLPTGWRFFRKGSKATTNMRDYLNAYWDRSGGLVARLHNVSLECRDAIEVIKDYGRDDDTLIYCDPPYLGDVAVSRYPKDFASTEQHSDLAAALNSCTATVLLSGYDSYLYRDLFAGWWKHEFEASTTNGSGDHKRTEVVWSNREIM